VCLALDEPTRTIEREIGTMILDTLAAMDCAPRLVTVGDPTITDCDVFLLVGDAMSFEPHLPVLRQRGDRRPRTILWQIHPLLPPVASDRAEQASRWLTAVDRPRSGPLAAIVRCLIPLSVRQRLRAPVRARLAERVRRDDVTVDELGLNQLPWMVMRHEWIRAWVIEGILDSVVVSGATRATSLRDRGVRAAFVPFGYHPGMGRDHGRVRDIDVLFFGHVQGSRRERILNDLQSGLAARGHAPIRIETDCYGAEREILLNRTKICLNLPILSWEFAGIRLLRAIACGALVVSETLLEPAPYVPGLHFVQTSLQELPDTLKHYLEHTDDREKITRDAHAWLAKELTLERSISMILDPQPS
jgi:hypothetical protein